MKLGILLTITVVLGAYSYFNFYANSNGKPALHQVSAADTHSLKAAEEASESDQQNTVTRFAAALEADPTMMNMVAPKIEKITTETSLQKLLSDPTLLTDRDRGGPYLDQLLANRSEAISLMLSQFPTLNGKENAVQQEQLLRLTAYACGGQANQTCTDFFSKQAANEELTPLEQVISFRGFLGTKTGTKEERLQSVQAFMASHPQPEFQDQLKEIEAYEKSSDEFAERVPGARDARAPASH